MDQRSAHPSRPICARNCGGLGNLRINLCALRFFALRFPHFDFRFSPRETFRNPGPFTSLFSVFRGQAKRPSEPRQPENIGPATVQIGGTRPNSAELQIAEKPRAKSPACNRSNLPHHRHLHPHRWNCRLPTPNSKLPKPPPARRRRTRALPPPLPSHPPSTEPTSPSQSPKTSSNPTSFATSAPMAALNPKLQTQETRNKRYRQHDEILAESRSPARLQTGNF